MHTYTMSVTAKVTLAEDVRNLPTFEDTKMMTWALKQLLLHVDPDFSTFGVRALIGPGVEASGNGQFDVLFYGIIEDEEKLLQAGRDARERCKEAAPKANYSLGEALYDVCMGFNLGPRPSEMGFVYEMVGSRREDDIGITDDRVTSTLN